MSSVLITGASKGIGAAIAAEFAHRDWRVIATARDPRALSGLDVAERIALDVTDQASVDSAVAAAGDIDVLVSNAGVIFHSAVEAIPIAEISRLFELNTFGALRVAQAVLPQMRRRGSGRLLFLSSVMGRMVRPGSAAYASSKWALEAIAETLAAEVAPFGVRVGLMEPGAVSSGALDDVLRYTLDDDPYASIFTDAGSRPMITVAEVAAAVADAAEIDTLPLRWPIGPAAEQILGTRS